MLLIKGNMIFILNWNPALTLLDLFPVLISFRTSNMFIKAEIVGVFDRTKNLTVNIVLLYKDLTVLATGNHRQFYFFFFFYFTFKQLRFIYSKPNRYKSYIFMNWKSFFFFSNAFNFFLSYLVYFPFNLFLIVSFFFSLFKNCFLIFLFFFSPLFFFFCISISTYLHPFFLPIIHFSHTVFILSLFSSF